MPPSQEKLCANSQHDVIKTDKNRYAMGMAAESFVANELALKGWKILSRNYRGLGFEVDIIGMKDRNLAAIEVKCRNNQKAEIDLASLVPNTKKSSLKKGILAWLSKNPNTAEYIDTIRLDLAIVTKQDERMIAHYYSNIDWEIY